MELSANVWSEISLLEKFGFYRIGGNVLKIVKVPLSLVVVIQSGLWWFHEVFCVVNAVFCFPYIDIVKYWQSNTNQ